MTPQTPAGGSVAFERRTTEFYPNPANAKKQGAFDAYEDTTAWARCVLIVCAMLSLRCAAHNAALPLTHGGAFDAYKDTTAWVRCVFSNARANACPFQSRPASERCPCNPPGVQMLWCHKPIIHSVTLAAPCNPPERAAAAPSRRALTTLMSTATSWGRGASSLTA